MISASLVCFAILASGHSEPLISAQLAAEPASRLLPKLGKLVNLDLQADDSTKDDVLVLSVKDVTIKDLMSRIAKLDCASWKKDDTGALLLIRSSEQAKSQLQKEGISKLARIREMKAQLAKGIIERTVTTFAQADKAMEQMVADQEARRNPTTNPNLKPYISSAPHEMLAQRITWAIPDSVYASIPEDVSLVFSDKPNHVQIKLPIDIGPINKAYVQDSSLFKRAVNSPAVRNLNLPDYMLIGSQSSGEVPRKVLARITPLTDGSYRVRCRIYGSTGSDEVTTILSSFPSNSTLPKPRQSESLLKCAPQNMKDLLLTLQKNPISNKPNPKGIQFVNDEARSQFFNPVEFEPLQTLHGGVLLASAKEQNLNLVAVLSDRTHGLTFQLLRRLPGTVVDTENWIYAPSQWSQPDLEYAIDGKWLEVRPSTPSFVWTKHWDRPALKSVYEAMNQPNPSLDARASIAFNLPSDYALSLWLIGMRLCSFGLQQNLDLAMNYPKLRFWGSLSPTWKKALIDGRRLTLRSLSPLQNEALRSLIFQATDGYSSQIAISYDDPDKPSSQLNTFEATEAFPNGINPDAQMSVSVRDEAKVRVEWLNGTQDMDLTELAGNLLSLEAGNSSYRGLIESLQPLKSRKVTVTIDFEPGMVGKIEYEEVAEATASVVDDWQKLPKDLVERLKALKIELVEPKQRGEGKGERTSG